MTTAVRCAAHHWSCDPVAGRTSQCRCTECGETREFRNYLTPLEAMLIIEHKAPVKKEETVTDPKPKPAVEILPIELPTFALKFRAVSLEVPRGMIEPGRQIAALTLTGDEQLISDFAAAFQSGALSIVLVVK